MLALATLGAAGKVEILLSLLGRVAARNLEAARVAALAVLEHPLVSDAGGLMKEQLDALTHGSGFSFGDLAADRGSAIKGNRIDLCYNSRSQCYAFGRKEVTVHVLR